MEVIIISNVGYKAWRSRCKRAQQKVTVTGSEWRARIGSRGGPSLIRREVGLYCWTIDQQASKR